MPKVLKQGTIITCPNCHKNLYVLKRTLLAGEHINPKDFQPFVGIEDPIKDTPMVCPTCREQFFAYKKLHTSKGWL